MNFLDLHRNLKRLINELDDIVLRSAMENDSIIVDLNTNQMSFGLTNDNKPIEPELRSDEYAKYKKATGGKAPLFTPDLHNEGDFYRGIYVKQVSKELIIDSTDNKSEKLKAKYKKIFGLNNNSLIELKDFLIPILQKNIKNELKNG